MSNRADLAQSFTAILQRIQATRHYTLTLIESLTEADCVVQSMPDASPIKWHLAHTTWFFETFILEKFEADFKPFHPAFRVLFNSYYNGIGEKHPRPKRGLLTRPDLSEVLAYRRQVDERLATLWQSVGLSDVATRVSLSTLGELGIQHEQQHQELMLTDVKHLFSCNPLFPAMSANYPELKATNQPTNSWQQFDAALVEIGADGTHFCFDNEMPRHRTFVESFEIANGLVSNGDYLAFVEAGAYRDPALWLAEGWDWLQSQKIEAPIYWHKTVFMQGGQQVTRWSDYTLHGLQEIDPQKPVSHLSYFEAAAYAQWAKARLPTEAEWEHAANSMPTMAGLFQHCWQWTSSSYAAYPGFVAPEGAIGEYNGKFMVNQYVLRGSSCFTPVHHSRTSYRNFFPSTARWQMTGLRLARSC